MRRSFAVAMQRVSRTCRVLRCGGRFEMAKGLNGARKGTGYRHYHYSVRKR